MQYRFAVNFGTLSTYLVNFFTEFSRVRIGCIYFLVGQRSGNIYIRIRQHQTEDSLQCKVYNFQNNLNKCYLGLSVIVNMLGWKGYTCTHSNYSEVTKTFTITPRYSKWGRHYFELTPWFFYINFLKKNRNWPSRGLLSSCKQFAKIILLLLTYPMLYVVYM